MLTQNDINLITNYYIKGKLKINGLKAMGFEYNNIVKGLTPVAHMDYTNDELNITLK